MGKIKMKEKKRTNKYLSIKSSSLVLFSFAIQLLSSISTILIRLFKKSNAQTAILIFLIILLTGTAQASTYGSVMDVFEDFEWDKFNYQNYWDEINQKLYYNGTYNIGIGTLNPTEKLNLNGSLKVDNSTGSVLLFANTSKNMIGIGTISPSHTLTVAGDLNVTGTSYLGDLVIDSDNITVANLIGRGGDNIRIGDAGADDHSLAADDDLFISGKLEVDGTSYFDWATYFYYLLNIRDNIDLSWGNSPNVYLDFSTVQATQENMVWGLDDVGRGIIFTTKANRNQDFDHPAQSNPTIFLHSNEDPDNDNTRWGAISHDNDSMTIDSGTDEIMLEDETFVQGNLTIGDDEIGKTQGMFYHNGTVSIIQMMSPDETMWNCWVNNTGGWMCE